MENFLHFIVSNITHVGPILITAGFGVAIILDRTRALMVTYPLGLSEPFFERLRTLIMANKIAEAIGFCERFHRKPVAQVVKEGLLRAHQPENLIEYGLQIAVSEVSGKIQKRTSFLATIANVATLLGLFGTILGLIQSFEAVGAANPQQRSALLAAGIATAMNATMMGLGTAIPCMVAYSFLMNRTNQLIAKVDQAAIRTMDLLKQRYYATEENSTTADVAQFDERKKLRA